MNQRKWVVALSLLLCGISVQISRADFVTLGGGGAGDIPTPLMSFNQKVELAEGELYVLVGTIRFIKDQPMFEVDLREHPWLASAKRRSAPFYPLQAAAVYLRKFEHQRVRISAEVQGLIVHENGSLETARHVLTLQPLVDPVVLPDQH